MNNICLCVEGGIDTYLFSLILNVEPIFPFYKCLHIDFYLANPIFT